MNRRSLLILTSVVVAFGIVMAIIFAPKVNAPPAALGKVNLVRGQAAPPFQVSSTAGSFDSTTVHGPILLEVFATWCPHCQREVAILNHIQADYGKRLKIIAVSGSELAADEVSPESQVDVVNFAQRFGVIYPIAYDPSLSVARDYLFGGFPTVIVIDRNGRIASFTSGEATEPTLRKRINLVL